ncbi:MAG: aminotransferase class V-fold PLP-dependent enzyme [Ignavibacteria bacterium]
MKNESSYLDEITKVEESRVLFPFTKTCTYLDSAHYCPYNIETRRRLTNFINAFTTQNIHLGKFTAEIKKRLKLKIARFINASEKEIIITSNTTHGLNIIANGFRVDETFRVAVADSEFPALVYPWMNQKKLGRCELVFIPSINGKINYDDIEFTLTANKIDILAVSSVGFLGFRHNLKKLYGLCMANGVYLVVDAIQSMGIVPFDALQEQVHFLAAGGQKWLMSPAGIGFAYLPESMRKLIEPTYVGTTSIEYDFENFLNYKLNFQKDGSAYENSTLNLLGMIGLESSIDLFTKLGVSNIFNHILKLLDSFIEGIRGLPYYVESDISEDYRSNILIFSHINKVRNKSIQQELERQNIFIALREGFLRISPHIFNNMGDIRRLLIELERLA